MTLTQFYCTVKWKTSFFTVQVVKDLKNGSSIWNIIFHTEPESSLTYAKLVSYCSCKKWGSRSAAEYGNRLSSTRTSGLELTCRTNRVDMASFIVPTLALKRITKGNKPCEVQWNNNRKNRKISFFGKFVRAQVKMKTAGMVCWNVPIEVDWMGELFLRNESYWMVHVICCFIHIYCVWKSRVLLLFCYWKQFRQAWIIEVWGSREM